jgi:hypothetical protein
MMNQVCAVAHYNTFIAPDGYSYLTEFSWLDCEGRVLLVRITLPPHVVYGAREPSTCNSVYSCPTLLYRREGVEELKLSDLKRMLTRKIWPEIRLENENAKVGICFGRRDQRKFFRNLNIPSEYVEQTLEDKIEQQKWYIDCRNHLDNSSLKCSLAYTIRLLAYCPKDWSENAFSKIVLSGYAKDCGSKEEDTEELNNAIQALTV